MSNYQLPPDMADSFNALAARVAALERGARPARVGVSYAAASPTTNVASGADFVVPFDTVDFDVLGMWNPALPTRLTAPPGITLSVFTGIGIASTPGPVQGKAANARLRRNGSALVSNNFYGGTSFLDSFSPRVTAVAAFTLSAGDYVELVATQFTGAILAMRGESLSLTIQR